MNARPGKRRFWRTEPGTLACRGGTPGGVAWRRKTETAGVPGRLEGVSVAKSGVWLLVAQKPKGGKPGAKESLLSFVGWQQS